MWSAASQAFNISLDDDGDLWLFGKLGEYGRTGGDVMKVDTLSKMKDVSRGTFFFACVDFEGQVWAYGHWNRATSSSTLELEAISGLFDIQKVFCGPYSTFCIDFDDNIYSFGRNTSGCLGVGEVTNIINSPLKIPNLPKIIEIACGNAHTLFLDSNGNVFYCGQSTNGECGIPSQESENIPRKHPTLKNIVKISCGDEHSIVMDNKDHVYSFGKNDNGRLGLGHTLFVREPKLVPMSEYQLIKTIEASGVYSLFLDSDGGLYMAGGTNLPMFGGDRIIIPRIIAENVISISNGPTHFIYRTSRKIYRCGVSNSNDSTDITEYSSYFKTPISIYSKVKSARK